MGFGCTTMFLNSAESDEIFALFPIAHPEGYGMGARSDEVPGQWFERAQSTTIN